MQGTASENVIEWEHVRVKYKSHHQVSSIMQIV